MNNLLGQHGTLGQTDTKGATGPLGLRTAQAGALLVPQNKLQIVGTSQHLEGVSGQQSRGGKAAGGGEGSPQDASTSIVGGQANGNSGAGQNQQSLDLLSQSMADTWLSIASLAETLGDTDRAAMAYDATLQYNPSSTKALTSLAHLYRSHDVFQRAAELYQRALAVNPELGDIWATLGYCYLMLDDLQRAYVAHQQALYHLSNPNVPKLWHGIGILYDRYGSLEYAEEAFAKVLELDSHFERANEIYFRLGIIYKHQGKWSQALECFRYILPLPPAPLQEWDVWFQIGSVLESMCEWQGAREAYEHVLSQNELHAKVLQQLGCLYGMSNVQFYDLQTASNLLLKSLEVDSTDATTWYHLGRIHMVRNDYTAAYDAFQQAVNRDSRNPTFWCSIGVLYYQISQYRDALDAYTRAIRLNPYISEVWYDLGTLYETCNNQLSDAWDAYKQAARLDPNNIHIRERLEALTAQLSNQTAQHIPKQQQLKVQAYQRSIQAQHSQQQDHSQHLQPQKQLCQQQSKTHAPVILQPTLQQQDQIHPLDNKHVLYRSGQPPLQGVADATLMSVPQSNLPGRQQLLHQLPADRPMVENFVLPQKRPMDCGMDTLVDAISQQEQEKQQRLQPVKIAPLENTSRKRIVIPPVDTQINVGEQNFKRQKHDPNMPNLLPQILSHPSVSSMVIPVSATNTTQVYGTQCPPQICVQTNNLMPITSVFKEESTQNSPVTAISNTPTVKNFTSTSLPNTDVNSKQAQTPIPPSNLGDTTTSKSKNSKEVKLVDCSDPSSPTKPSNPRENDNTPNTLPPISRHESSNSNEIQNIPTKDVSEVAQQVKQLPHTNQSVRKGQSYPAKKVENEEQANKLDKSRHAETTFKNQSDVSDINTEVSKHHNFENTKPLENLTSLESVIGNHINEDSSSSSVTMVALDVQTIKDTKETTFIKPSLDALELLQEEAKLRQEEEREAFEKKIQNSIASTTELPNESIIRKVEEDENYDD